MERERRREKRIKFIKGTVIFLVLYTIMQLFNCYQSGEINIVDGILRYGFITAFMMLLYGLSLAVGTFIPALPLFMIDHKLNGMWRVAALAFMGVFVASWQCFYIRKAFHLGNDRLPEYLANYGMIIVSVFVFINIIFQFKKYMKREETIVWLPFIGRTCLQIMLLLSVYAPFSGIR